jgi:beta-galactosidase
MAPTPWEELIMSGDAPGLDFFPLGSSYYPPFHTPDDWVTDVGRMAEAGLNAIRTAELIASWEWLEPEKGRFDFGWLDRIFDLSEKQGLRVLLGTGAGSPPIWLLDEYPDVQIVSQDGVTYPTGTMWGWACFHHPGFRAESERYLRTLLERYQGHPALFGWQIHNEPGHPAIQHAGRDREFYCYCQHSAAGFRAWLQEKYSDVEALSEAWACTPTRHRYHDWAQVRPPRSPPLAWGSPGAWLDWRVYIDQSWADFVAWQNSIIKESDRRHPTTTNLVHLLADDLGTTRGIDPWRYPSTCDGFGFDLYPVDRFKAEPFFTSLQLDYARSPALHAGKPFWVPEIESGPIGEWVLGPSHTTTARDIRRYDLDCIAHGAKMLLYQGYREWDPLPLHWGALVDLNGEPTERFHEAAHVNRVVQSHETLFLRAQPVRAQIGILVDQRSAIASAGMGAAEILLKAIKGVYSAYWSHTYPVEFVTPELLANGKGNGYRLLLMPFMVLVTPACARAVTSFVGEGGTAVAFAKCGMLDDKSWTWHDRPGGLTKLFGVKETRIAKSDAVTLAALPDTEVFDGITGPLQGYWHRQDFAADDGVDVLARYHDGAPAVVMNQYGRGRAVLFGTHFDVAALAPQSSGHRQVFANLAGIAGVTHPFQVTGGPLLDGHLLVENGQQEAGPWGLFVLINHGPEAAEARVHLPHAVEATSVTDLFAETELNVASGADGTRFETLIDGYGSTAFLLE